ncbi:MAG: type II toxin-antitoxin system RelE/ParE family toxin [Acidobacteriota bacterium]
MSYRIRPEARRELLEAIRWYEDQERGLGKRFVDVMDAGLQKTLSHPQLYQEVDPGIRRIPLKPFPYSAFYTEISGAIHVLSVYNDRRNPKIWRNRVSKRRSTLLSDND